MKIADLKEFGFEKVNDCEEDGELHHGYTCDLLSEVMANAQNESVWFTVQSHVNIVAVAAITGIKAIVLCNGHSYDTETVRKAEAEKVALFTTSLNPFEAGGKVYTEGLR